MHTVPSSLLSRLRPRLAAMARLFALLMLAKFAFATACLADDFPTTSGADAIVATMIASDSGTTGGSGDCLHAGKAGCHCTCAHSTALPALDGVEVAVPAAITLASKDLSSLRPTRLQTDLRPPIA